MQSNPQYLVFRVFGILAIILGIYWSRDFLQTAIGRTRVTGMRLSLLGVFFLVTGLITGAADIGTIAFGICALVSVFLLNPFYVRDKTRSESGTSYVSWFTALMIILIIGLGIFPEPLLISASSRVEEILILYALFGGFVSLAGPTIKKYPRRFAIYQGNSDLDPEKKEDRTEGIHTGDDPSKRSSQEKGEGE